MAERINLGWLKDYNSVKFAPKTVYKQVLTDDGRQTLTEEISDMWDAIKYKPITITSSSYTNSNITGNSDLQLGLFAEAGTTIGTITFKWATSKTPSKIEILKGSTVVATPAATATSYALTANLTSSATYTIRVTEQSTAGIDELAQATKAYSYTFGETCYYGALAQSTTPTSANIVALDVLPYKSMHSSTSFTTTAGSGQCLVFATPSSFGTPTFTVGGFEGGFTKKSTISLTNGSGKTQNYDVYFSDQVNLGNTTVSVSL